MSKSSTRMDNERRARSSRRHASLAALASIVMGLGSGMGGLAGCEPKATARDEIWGKSVEARARELLALEDPSTEDLVALSEALAVESARAETAESAKLARLAGDLRARAFRIRHAEPDARAALALYGFAAKSAGPEACEVASLHASLAAEVAHDPAVFHREAALAIRAFEGTPCALSLASKLRTLEAFRPDDAVRDRGPGSEPAPSVVAGSADRAVQPTTIGTQRIVAVDPYGSHDRARVVVTLSGPTDYEARSLPGAADRPATIEVDLASVDATPREIEVGGLVERLRISPGERGARISLDLSASASHRVFTLPEPYRLVLDIATQAPPKLPPPPGAPRVVRRVAIDPGHGGTDPGAIGPSGLREKDITLDIAHRVAPILARELGVMTLLTRDDDRYVPLAERTARANAFHADLFISIHCNASESSTARGVATFVFDTTRDENLAKIAARENATSLAASLDLPSFGTDLGPVELGARSRHLAELLERTTMASLLPRWRDTSSYGVKAAGFFVLVGAEMPSVLFETSFISNPIEEARLATPEYRQKLADAVVNAVRAYREGR